MFVHVYVCVCVRVCNCMHPHMGSVLYVHGFMGINCQMFAPTTFKVFQCLWSAFT